MDTNLELEKNGIKIICPISEYNVNEIATYVANILFAKFPTLRLSYNTIFMNIAKIPMYIAEMPEGMSDACYFYKNSSIYFKKGLKFDVLKKLAFHECIHHFQEIKDSNGKLHRLGLCSYLGNKAFGSALNESAVQLMSSYAISEKHDIVKYYDITFPTDSPSYYPLLCNLIKQVGYLTGFSALFESTFYSNDVFFDKFKTIFGERNAFKIQDNFDKLLDIEEKIIKLNNKIQQEDLSYHKFKSSTATIAKYKKSITNLFLSTQNLIISSFFDAKLLELDNANKIEQYRKCLYSFSNLIGTTETYSFFNDYYINKMAQLDLKYEQITNKNDVSLAVVKTSKIATIFKSIKKLFMGNASEYNDNL